jgi:hypothetical protein
MTPVSTDFTERFLVFRAGHKNHDATGGAMIYRFASSRIATVGAPLVGALFAAAPARTTGVRSRSRATLLRARAENGGHVKRETGPEKDCEGWSLCFSFRFARFAK